MSENEHAAAAIAGKDDGEHWLLAWFKAFPGEFARCWNLLPNKGLFLIGLAAWLALFQFLGNSVFSFFNTHSLMGWMWNVYLANDGEDGHGRWMPLVVLALFWWKRRQLVGLPNRLWWPGLAIVTLSLLLHVIGFMIQQPRISIVAMFAGIYGLMALAWGPRWLAESFFPYFLLFFCIPLATVTQPFTFDLRLMVTKIVATLSHFIGIHVLREGTQLFNAQRTYTYEVAAACSGLRSLVAIFALSTAYGFMNFDRTWKRLVMMAASVPLAIIGNVLRMVVIIIAAEMGGQDSGNFVHDNWFFSLLPYAPAIAGIILIDRWMAEKKDGVSPRLQSSPA